MTTLSRFEIHQPASVREASQMLTHYGDDAGFYAGGTELLLAMRHKALTYRHLIDLKVIPGLNTVTLNGNSIEIGAACTHRSVERSEIVRQRQPVLSELESHVANVRVRATGTLGGNLCFAEPHSDPATLLLILEARLKVEREAGAREIPIADLIGGPYTNRLEPGEILTTISIPCASANERTAYVKFQVRERPTLGIGLSLQISDDGSFITKSRVAIGCVCPFPTRVPLAEELLTGFREDVQTRLPLAAVSIADSADLIDDNEGTASYKRHLIGVFLGRVLSKALGQRAA